MALILFNGLLLTAGGKGQSVEITLDNGTVLTAEIDFRLSRKSHTRVFFFATPYANLPPDAQKWFGKIHSRQRKPKAGLTPSVFKLIGIPVNSHSTYNGHPGLEVGKSLAIRYNEEETSPSLVLGVIDHFSTTTP